MAESSRTFSAKIVVQRARLHRREHCYNHDGNPSQDHSHWLWILKYVKRASYEVLVTTMSLVRKIGTFRPEEDDCMLSLDCSVSCAGRFKLLRAPAVGSKSVPIRALQYLVNRVNLKKSLAQYLWSKCYFNSRPMLFAFVALGNLIYWNIHAVFERKSSVTVFIYNFFLPLRPYSLVIEHLRSCLFKTVLLRLKK